ncbi:MAG: hypothetical protein ACPGYP_06005 [Solirubrobacterales bacterium]
MPLSRVLPHDRSTQLTWFFRSSIAFFLVLSFVVSAAATASAKVAETGGAGYAPAPATQPGMRAKLSSDGRTAIAPEGAPLEVKKAIWAANEITNKPYLWGGGHASFKAKGYDCSGTISYALNGAGLLDSPMPSGPFMSWGRPGKGSWITIYAHSGHMYAIIAGLRFDTSGKGERGPRWRPEKRSSRGFAVRHPAGF